MRSTGQRSAWRRSARGTGVGYGVSGDTAEQVDPAVLALPGTAPEVPGEGLGAIGHAGQHGLDLVDRIESVAPFGSSTQLARGLWAPKHQHCQNRHLTAVEAERLIDDMAVLFGSTGDDGSREPGRPKKQHRGSD